MGLLGGALHASSTEAVDECVDIDPDAEKVGFQFGYLIGYTDALSPRRKPLQKRRVTSPGEFGKLSKERVKSTEPFFYRRERDDQSEVRVS